MVAMPLDPQDASVDLRPEELLKVLERVNQIAASDHLGPFLRGMLELILKVCQAKSGLVYLLNPQDDRLVCQSVVSETLVKPEQCPSAAGGGLLDRVMQTRQPVTLKTPSAIKAWQDEPIVGIFSPQRLYALPLCLQKQLLGVVVILDERRSAHATLDVLARRMASEVDKLTRIQEMIQRNNRLSALISIFGQISATLDRDQILRMMVNSARDMINAEASSLFLVDEAAGDMVLHLASNVNEEIQSVEQVRVPAGKGIIGHVVETGEIVLVPDVTRDGRHYTGVDQNSGFVTRAILAVPLRTRQVVLGGDRGTIQERVIGGFEALNKFAGTFDQEDANLLATLANQAATVLEIATLYGDANQLFLDVIAAWAAAIDAKDPYTEGHSQRVCDFSMEIAREMGLSDEEIHYIRVGSLLHDVGKIGVPDTIITKPGRLTEAEYIQMRQHPTIGGRIMGKVQLLLPALPALAEHHERLDGTGYPRGLKGDEISQVGRVVAAADVFDALTSDRPYRQASSAEEAIAYLYQRVGMEFDGRCVDALARAYMRGSVKTQKESALPNRITQ